KRPRRFPAGACQITSVILENAVSAEEQGERVLVLQLINGCRLGGGSNTRARDCARVLLVQERVAQVRSERQALDRSPDGVDTDNSEVEVRVTSTDEGERRNHVGADRGLAPSAILQLSIRTIDGSDPVGIPVMGITTTEAPALDGFNSRTGGEDTIRNAGDTDALVGPSQSRAAVHEEGLREQGLEVVVACPIGIDSLQVDDIPRSGRDVLDRQGTHHSPAPLIGRMTGGFRRAVVSSVHVMRSNGKLGKAPSLVDLELTEDVG